MRVRSIDENNDWTFGKGLQNYKLLNNNIKQNVITRLQSFRSDCFFALDEGVDWYNLLGEKNTQEEIILQVKRTILQTPGVVRINSLDIYSNSDNRSLTLTVNIDTLYTNNVQIQLENIGGEIV
jgi:hypothetical protein